MKSVTPPRKTSHFHGKLASITALTAQLKLVRKEYGGETKKPSDSERAACRVVENLWNEIERGRALTHYQHLLVLD